MRFQKARQDDGAVPNTRPGAALAVAELARDSTSAHISLKASDAAVHHVVEARRPAAPRRPPPRRFIVLEQVRADAAEEVLAGLRIRVRDERRAPRVGRGGERDRGVAFSPLERARAAAAARSRGLVVDAARAATRRRKWEVETSPGAAAASSTRRGPHHNKFEAFAQLQFTERQSFRFSDVPWYQPPSGTRQWQCLIPVGFYARHDGAPDRSCWLISTQRGTSPTARYCCTTSNDGPKLDATSSPNTSRSKEVSAAGKNRQRLEPQTFTDHEKLLTTSQCSFVRVPAAPKYLCGNQIVAARLRHG